VVVEDDDATARLEQRELVRRGYRVEVFASAGAALAAAPGLGAECWLVDQSLPGGETGLGLVDALRQRGIDAPVVLVTGNPNPDVLLRALRAGVRDFVQKGEGFLELLVSRVNAVITAARAEHDLQRSRALAETESMRRRELEAEIAERRRAEAVAKDAIARLRDADRRKDEFLAMLAHELRNPLAPIGSAVEVLREDADPQRVRWAVGVIGRQLDQMRRIVDDLLDVARIMSGRFTLRREPLHLASVLTEAIERSQPAMQARDHTFSYEPAKTPLTVEGDRVRLVQAVANLLDNAAKYTPTRGRITLSVQQRAGQAQVTVDDNGIGMQASAIDDLFSLFVQGRRNPDRADGGLGLGLALVRRIVDLHGGSVTAASAGPGTGSTFRISLPLSDAKVAEPASPPEPISADSQGVLVVDDNVDAAESLAVLLRLWGFEVATAHDGEAAIAAIARLDPDAVLLDLGLPKSDGFEVIRSAPPRSNGATRLWLAVSGYGQAADRERTRAAGFHAHLVKPVQMEALQRALAPLLQRH